MRFCAGLVLLCAVLAACGGGEGSPSPPPTSPGRTPDTGGLDLSGGSATEGATVEAGDGRIVTRLPTSECIQATATPLVIGEYVIFPTHKKARKPDSPYGVPAECRDDGVQPGLYAVSQVTGQAYTLMQVNAEAAPTYAGGTIIIPLLDGGIAFWRNGKGEVVDILSAGMDSAGLWDPRESVYVVGSVNTPFDQCQRPVNDDCGSLIAVSGAGDIVRRLDRQGSFRAWVTGGVTSDGQRYYVGTGMGLEGEVVPGYAPACQVLALTRDFTVAGGYDDGTYQCTEIGRLESAVVGELPIARDVIWVQHVGSTTGGPFTPIVQLRKQDLSLVCRPEIPALPWEPTALYYQAPVIDAEGNAWITVRTSDNGGNASLIRIEPTCARTVFANTTSKWASTPTLAEDRFVLAAWDGKLNVIDRTTRERRQYELGVNESVIAGPVVSQYGVTVVGESGTVTTFTGTGIDSYGSDPWPRFRKDNYGSATAD